ncbi:glycine cleavage system protein R [Paraglaciecola hydrolytica]|uniref:Glycine cleavage system transcriptional repressor n=1 Tax=Paraglaciecola hydrolytica TaxID=1799789 RepID=A0A136A122_9ALTE|nr:ACT domain-containing protein [Paraglaciecola hydrolytica]KXI28924.1 glycine cleavage system transcriptional repressor [Paraglaciecola hydrolytica]
MTQQLIVTILGNDKFGMLSAIAETVCEVGCNILDSRQAVFGQDFSLTMIIEGSQAAIAKAEFAIPQTCQKLELLCLMKRTKRHNKQNLEHIADVSIKGENATGVIKKITGFFTQFTISVSAFRLKTLKNPNEVYAAPEHMKCKMVVSIPHTISVEDVEAAFQTLMAELNLQGSIKLNH